MNLTLRLLLCCGLLLGQPASAGTPRQEELEQLRERIRTLQQALEQTTETKSEAADSLRESEQAISNSNRALADLAEQKHNSTLELRQLGQRSGQIGKDMEGQQALLGKLMYQQYVSGQHEYLRLLFNGRNPNQIARDLSYYEYIARDRAAWLDKLRANLAQLASVTEQTREKRAQIVALQQEEQTQKAKLEKEKGARQKMLADLAQKLKQQRREIARMQENEGRLTKLMEQLAKLRAKPRPKERPPVAANHAPPLQQNEKLPDNRHDGSNFAQLRGKLALPVKGAISNQFGATRPDSTMQWKGLFMRATAGQPVKAVAAGQVVYADWLRGFGNLLIVDHGDGYMSLYGNNETLYKQVGDELRGGDTVAAVGNSGGNETSGLYFELRHEGKPFDPMKWVGGR